MSNKGDDNIKLDKTNMPDYGDYGLSTKYEDNHPVANPDKSHSSKSDDIANESLINQPGDNVRK